MKIKNVKNNVEIKSAPSFTWSYLDIENKVEAGVVSAQRGITLIAFAISRKCVRYEERA